MKPKYKILFRTNDPLFTHFCVPILPDGRWDFSVPWFWFHKSGRIYT